MVKLNYERDYYGDLDLPPNADAADVKKQFKKLALKFHPDRNPGKEDEAKEKFLVIQEAHEILSDPTNKAKFDGYRLRTASARYSGASGVRGNPWQNTANEVNSRYGAPPKRPQMPTRHQAPTAAASAKPWDWVKTKSKADYSRANTDAWDRARPHTRPTQPSATTGGASASARPPKVPPREPPTPRTASQARRQEASFGTRKTGYAPGSPMGDEPPVKNPHYNTAGASASAQTTSQPSSRSRPTSAYVDPLSAQFGDAFMDNRQSTPYAANVGEKTNPFEPLNVNRAKSMRDNGRRFQEGAQEAAPAPPSRQRSASTGSEGFKRTANPGSGANEQSQQQQHQQQQPHSTFHYQSRASARYSPRGAETDSAPTTATFQDAASSTSSVNSANGKITHSSLTHMEPARPATFAFPAYSHYQSSQDTTTRSAPSGEKRDKQDKRGSGATGFQDKLHAQLQQLLSETWPPVTATMPAKKPWVANMTDDVYTLSSSGSGTDPNASTNHHPRFSRNSADNINTRFVGEEKGGSSNFQFSAGATGSADDSFLRAKHRARGHQSPLRNEFTASAESANGAQHQAEAAKKQGDFDAEQWADKFGPHVFVPAQPGKPSTSPTRPIRPIKKPRPVRVTAGGAAGMVDDEETSGEDKGKARVSGASTNGINGSRSPNAMDIDTPPPEPADAQQSDSPKTANSAAGPRNIPVEPTKPEWRPGNGVTAEPKLGSNLKMPNIAPTAGGSEDADDFSRPIFAEFRNVEPFAAPKATGLGSLNDLSSNLPFASRASNKIPINLTHHQDHASSSSTKPLDIPTPPSAPRAPPSLCIPGAKFSAPAWRNYETEFEAYMVAWFAFNRRMTDHFAARQRRNEEGGLDWLNAQGDGGVNEYVRALDQDRYVRQKWMAACEKHELHFREFMQVRDRLLAAR
ncbi:uncharacterized protein C8A04DRAFT_14576 [Dichotomopilus funicola]|uniref:J domain-containing protein n=1 Tax=Dichotomopilus funicola TaxID=1934379 RepID=A0AAN6ZIV0_9PEZI|nr:hypothetical protein C8A04DRAFT_14576 [Dichotomopilus funicola]